jgi:cytochrome c-type biogenesis protein CcmH/NrfG
MGGVLVKQAIDLLNKYLETNQEDAEAWAELADIYLKNQCYAKAAFCYEEIVLKEPKNYLVNLRYAEILYACSSNRDRLSDLVNARKYFSHAAILKQGEPEARAMWGLLKTCQAIDKINKKEDVKNTEMIAVTKRNIKEMYERKTKMQVNNMPSL